MLTIPIYIGVDSRQPIAFQVLAHSIYTRCSVPVSITPLYIDQLPIKRMGLTQFTYTRYLVPWLSKYQGRSIFLDADMLVLGDIYELYTLADPSKDVCVVKNRQKFEWASMMVFNNERCKKLTPQYIDDPTSKPMTFEWTDNIGELPNEWNYCVGYDVSRETEKLIHFTQGIPCFSETQSCEYAKEWQEEYKLANSTVPWEDIMGSSVHKARMGL